MISHRLGRKLPASQIRREVNEYPLLAERFIDNPAADALLSRQYRQPFVVPKIE